MLSAYRASGRAPTPPRSARSHKPLHSLRCPADSAKQSIKKKAKQGAKGAAKSVKHDSSKGDKSSSTSDKAHHAMHEAKRAMKGK